MTKLNSSRSMCHCTFFTNKQLSFKKHVLEKKHEIYKKYLECRKDIYIFVSEGLFKLNNKNNICRMDFPSNLHETYVALYLFIIS